MVLFHPIVYFYRPISDVFLFFIFCLSGLWRYPISIILQYIYRIQISIYATILKLKCCSVILLWRNLARQAYNNIQHSFISVTNIYWLQVYLYLHTNTHLSIHYRYLSIIIISNSFTKSLNKFSSFCQSALFPSRNDG